MAPGLGVTEAFIEDINIMFAFVFVFDSFSMIFYSPRKMQTRDRPFSLAKSYDIILLRNNCWTPWKTVLGAKHHFLKNFLCTIFYVTY